MSEKDAKKAIRNTKQNSWQNGGNSMVEPSLENLAFRQQFERAQSAASQANRTESRVISAAYDSSLGLVIITIAKWGDF